MMTYVWGVSAIILLLIEALTAQLVSIWFFVGAIGALVASFFTDSIIIQIIVFIILSMLVLIILRPLLKKLISFKKEDTNIGRYIGKKAFVLSEINNDLGIGQVNVNGSLWGARSIDDSIIKEGEMVRVESINGVKLNVSLIKNGDE